MSNLSMSHLLERPQFIYLTVNKILINNYMSFSEISLLLSLHIKNRGKNVKGDRGYSKFRTECINNEIKS